ncbi:Phage terminase large subunit (GpA) [Sporomusa termitida]|uniref:Phage terminase large subunit (GpA) n=1 Tax=Sporomusa termitida TaxID=2377 RepID=A0A517DVG3_9FIRM|nr:Phage terminase large subunit (GpA) [Sporomusa termitida]
MPGKWQTSRTPYLREIMDAFTNPDVEEIIFCKASQIGGTEALLNIPTLLVYPTLDLAEFASSNRIQPMVTLIPETAACYSGKDSKTLELQFDGMYLALSGANSPASLSSRPIRYLLLDEVDKYPANAGKEADPISLARERTKTFHNKTIVLISTPTFQTGAIWQAFESADERRYFYVPCPHCGKHQILKMSNVRWPKEVKDPAEAREKAWYVCEHCQEIIRDHHKQDMLRGGRWISDNTTGRVSRRVAFHLSSIYSPWLTFGDIAAEFLKSKAFPFLLQNFVNSWLAEPWKTEAKRYNSDLILAKRAAYPKGRVHQDAQLLVAGVDVQLNHFWWGVRAWGPDLTSWLVDYGRTETWADIETILRRPYPTNETGEVAYIAKAGIDSGYNTDEVYRFCAYNQDICVPTKGSSRPLRSRYVQTKIEKDIALGLILYIFDPNQFKDFIAGRLAHEVNMPGAWMVPEDIDRLYADHIVSEQRIEKKSKAGVITFEWSKVSTHAQNHLLDVEVNCALAAEICGARYLQKKPVMIQPLPAQPANGNKWLGNTSNWIKR